MAIWGITDETFANNVGASFFRLMGGTPPEAGTLNSVFFWGRAVTTSATIRLMVYQGGALDDPIGADLIAEGTVDVTVSSTPSWHEVVLSGEAFDGTDPLWIGVKSDEDPIVYWSTNSADAGDFQSVRGRADITGATNGTNPDEAAPDPLDGTDTFSDAWYPWKIDYTAAASTPAGQIVTTVYHDIQ